MHMSTTAGVDWGGGVKASNKTDHSLGTHSRQLPTTHNEYPVMKDDEQIVLQISTTLSIHT